MSNKKNVVNWRAVKEQVLGITVLRGYARLCDLSLASEADVFDPKKNPQGTQRDLSPKHAKDAYTYISQEEIAFWPEIFLNLREKDVAWIMPVPGCKDLVSIQIDLDKINRNKHISISRVDGNHRLYFAGGQSSEFPPITKIVSFCLAIELSLDQEIKVFRDINNNQRRMNTSHLDNIQIRLSEELELARRDPMLYIANSLKNDQDSPLFDCIYDGGASNIKKFIPLRTLKTGFEYMFSRPTALTAIDDISIQIKLIKSYFEALKKWQPDAWKRPKEYLLLRGAGLWGACFLGAEVINRVLSRGEYKTDDMLRILKSGRNWDWGKDGDFKGLSGRAGAVKIRDYVVSEFQDENTASLKTIMKKIASDL